MIRFLVLVFFIFVIPMAIALTYAYLVDRAKAREKLRKEWRRKLVDIETVIGRKMTHDEIKKWLVAEWYEDRIRKADGFAHEISVDLIEHP